MREQEQLFQLENLGVLSETSANISLETALDFLDRPQLRASFPRLRDGIDSHLRQISSILEAPKLDSGEQRMMLISSWKHLLQQLNLEVSSISTVRVQGCDVSLRTQLAFLVDTHIRQLFTESGLEQQGKLDYGMTFTFHLCRTAAVSEAGSLLGLKAIFYESVPVEFASLREHRNGTDITVETADLLHIQVKSRTTNSKRSDGRHLLPDQCVGCFIRSADSRAEVVRLDIYYNPDSRALHPESAEPSDRFLSDLHFSMKSALERVSPHAVNFLRH